jgi:sugar phosphate isomerase/epimerase
VEERHQVIADALAAAEMAARHGITLSLEYHDETLTDDRASVAALMQDLTHPNIEFLWQPSNGESMEACTQRLLDVLPRLRNVHVFHWWPTARERHPLSAGEARWRVYIDILRETGKTIDLLLEFVAGDSPDQLLADAATLRALLSMAKP